MSKIVFIINPIQQQLFKRVEDFMAHGYDVEAYYFTRTGQNPFQQTTFPIHKIGEFDTSLSYVKRLPVMYKALKPVFDKYKQKDVWFYYYQLDVALVCHWISHRPFLYECYDLMHHNMSSSVMRFLFDTIEKYIVKKSTCTLMTSQGFVQHYWGEKQPKNVFVVPNRLDKEVLTIPYHSHPYDINHLRFGFVGVARDENVFRFAKILVTHFPQHEMHFFGLYRQDLDDYEGMAKQYPNFHLHGPFTRHPQDLPSLYEQIDITVIPFEYIKHGNHRYTDHNKLYEGIFFETPLVVSQGSFTGQQVEKMDIGFTIDATDEEQILTFIRGLNSTQLDTKLQHIRSLDKKMCINDNPQMFIFLQTIQ